MRNFTILYVYELKKICKRKIVWITMGIIIAIILFWIVGEGLTKSYEVTIGQNSVYMTGFEYFAYKKENVQALNGQKIDDAMLEEVKDAYRRMSEREDEQVDLEEIARKREQYNEIYKYVYNITKDWNLVYVIDASTLYQMRLSRQQDNWTDQQLTEKEKAYWMKKEDKIEKPFVYCYMDGWEKILQEFQTLNVMLILAVIICLSNTFSDEHLRKTDQIILSSRCGKKTLFFSKITAGMTFGLGIGILLLLTAVFSTLGVYGAEGADAAVQICLPICARNLTIAQAVLLMSVVYVVAGVFYSVITMFLSEAMKNSVAVMGTMIGSMLLTMSLTIPYHFRVLSQIYELLPTVLLSMWQLCDDRLINVFGRYFTNFESASVIYIVISGGLIFAGNRIYKNYQVSGR